MKTITLYFWNEDHLGNETNTHQLSFETNIVGNENLYAYINETYCWLLNNFSYYAVIEQY